MHAMHALASCLAGIRMMRDGPQKLGLFEDVHGLSSLACKPSRSPARTCNWWFLCAFCLQRSPCDLAQQRRELRRMGLFSRVSQRCDCSACSK